MKLNKILPYKLSRVLPILGIAGASLFAGCNKEDEPIRDTRMDVEITFTLKDPWDVIQENPDGTRQVNPLIKTYADHPDIRTVYLVPLNSWMSTTKKHITDLRKNVLEYAINYSPKVRGRGDFNFWPGEASKVPEDSLWYVQNGWTINRHFQKQR